MREMSVSHFCVQNVGGGSGAVERSKYCHTLLAHLVCESMARHAVYSNHWVSFFSFFIFWVKCMLRSMNKTDTSSRSIRIFKTKLKGSDRLIKVPTHHYGVWVISWSFGLPSIELHSQLYSLTPCPVPAPYAEGTIIHRPFNQLL